MGTIVTIDVYTPGEATAAEIDELRRQLVRATTILQRADEVFSTWQPGSAISRLRAGEITTAEAPAEVADVLSRCATARELSGGWFDPWAMPGGIDPTGLVKGWAAQQALAAFTAPCIAGAMVNAAASSGQTCWAIPSLVATPGDRRINDSRMPSSVMVSAGMRPSISACRATGSKSRSPTFSRS